MKRRQLLPRRGMDPQPGIDLPEERLDLGRAPAGVSDGPGVVIGAVPPDGRAAVVGRAPSPITRARCNAISGVPCWQAEVYSQETSSTGISVGSSNRSGHSPLDGGP